MEKVYTIGEAAAALGMPASTIRYYDKNGLFPDMARSQGGIRVFTEDDLEWARFIERLKVSGMPIREIKRYIDLYREGDSTIEERRRIVNERREAILSQMEDSGSRSISSPTSAGITTWRQSRAPATRPRTCQPRSFRKTSAASRRSVESTGTKLPGSAACGGLDDGTCQSESA